MPSKTTDATHVDASKARARPGQAIADIYDKAFVDRAYADASVGGSKLTTLDTIAAGAGTIPSVNLPSELTDIHILSWFIPMTGVTDTQFTVTGELREVANTQAGDYATDFGVGNQHVYIYVDDITAGGDIVITGTSLSESTAVPVPADTETIVVDTSVDLYYQSDKKWLEVTNIDVSATTGIDYDIGIVGYIDLGNRNWRLEGFRAEFRVSSDTGDIRFRIRKVQDDGSKKMSLVPIEDIGFDSTVNNGQVYDHVRTGGDERSYTAGSTLAPNDAMFGFKQGDFSTFFSGDENILESADKAEGVIIDFLGEPSGGISAIDHGTITLYYKLGLT